MRILLVEDDRELSGTIKLQLEQAGYETDCCGQGQEAFYYASEYPYDVIILDRMLPQMDGLSVLQGLRRMDITTPVIITTALDGVNDRIDGLDAGADDYLVKPYASGELLARIRAVARQAGTGPRKNIFQYNHGHGPPRTGRAFRHCQLKQEGGRPHGIPDAQCRTGTPPGADTVLHMGA